MGEILNRLKVNSTPPRRIRKIIGDTSLTFPDAITEIVANSLDARQDEEGKVTIEVRICPEHVMVVDDASGMTAEVLEQAIRLGVDMGTVLGRGADRMGYFGLGMKTACASIGNWWSVVTRPSGRAEELVVEFDLLSDESDLGSSLWEDEIIVRRPDRNGPLGDSSHGTAVIIKKLHRYDSAMVGAALERLGEAFKGYLEQGDVIRVTGSEAKEPLSCKPRQPALISGSHVSFRIPLDKDDPTKVIRGWLGLTNTVSTKGDRGFNIYRKGQLIKAWSKDFYKYHPSTSYLLGDIHLDFMRANFFKKGLQEESDEWEQVKAIMTGFLQDAVAAARKVRKGRTRNELREITKMMRGTLREKAEHLGGEASFTEDSPSSSYDSSGQQDAPGCGAPGDSEGDVTVGTDDSVGGEGLPPPAPPIRVSLSSLTLDDGQEIALDFAEEALDTEVTPWDYMSPPGKDQLLAVANTKSELYRQLTDRRLLLALAVSDAILQFLMEQKGKPAYEARAVRNEWLHKFLLSKEVRL